MPRGASFYASFFFQSGLLFKCAGSNPEEIRAQLLRSVLSIRNYPDFWGGIIRTSGELSGLLRNYPDFWGIIRTSGELSVLLRNYPDFWAIIRTSGELFIRTSGDLSLDAYMGEYVHDIIRTWGDNLAIHTCYNAYMGR